MAASLHQQEQATVAGVERLPAWRSLLAGELTVTLHFQPIVDLEQGSVTGYEALARFPAVFQATPDICLAEARSLGLGLEVEDRLFRQAVAAHSFVPKNCFLSINVGPEYLVSRLCRAALEQKSDLTGLVFEVTEEASIADYRAVRDSLAVIRSLGGAVAVDDAGAGYASLSHILEIKPEFIKVDRRIVENCDQDRAKSTLIEMLGAAANRLDSWIIAEGVETPGELRELLLLGVPLAQGYFLARPASEMASCNSEAVAVMSSRRDSEGVERPLAALTSMHPSCHGTDEAEALLAQRPKLETVVLVDKWNRPLRLLQRHPLLGMRYVPSVMKVQVESDPGAVLQRALLRAVNLRFDPLAVISPEGHYLGLVDVDRLMSSMLGSPFPKSRRHVQ